MNCTKDIARPKIKSQMNCTKDINKPRTNL